MERNTARFEHYQGLCDMIAAAEKKIQNAISVYNDAI
jgi:hypothetical protein